MDFGFIAKRHIVPLNIAGKLKCEPLGIVVVLHQGRFLGRLVLDHSCDRVDGKISVGIMNIMNVYHYFLPHYCIGKGLIFQVSPFVCKIVCEKSTLQVQSAFIIQLLQICLRAMHNLPAHPYHQYGTQRIFHFDCPWARMLHTPFPSQRKWILYSIYT